MKIAVAGTGYVGLSIATLLAQHNEVVAVDVVAKKVAAINDRKSPIKDEYIEKFFAEKNGDGGGCIKGLFPMKVVEIEIVCNFVV